MKPNFALTLSADAIGLLHRSDGGWRRVGDVPLGDGDLSAALDALRDRARRLSGAPLCKLAIPNDQIKYISLQSDGDPDEAVRTALEGATPYAVDELEYDWTAADGMIQVAAVALETLAEAESFAAEHGFDAVSFAAIPDAAAFRGEPFFGVTRQAARLLPKGAIVERDGEPIRVIGDAEIPDPATEPPAQALPGGPDAPDGDTGDVDDALDDAPVASAAAQAVADAPPAPRQPAPETTDKKAADKTAQSPDNAQPPKQAKGKQSAAATAPEGEHVAPKPATEKGKTAFVPPVPAVDFTSIRAIRGDGGTGGATPPVAAQPRLTRLGGARTEETATPKATPPLPSPADGEVTDPARLAELAASLHPDPEERLDRDAAEEARGTAAAPSEKPGFLRRKRGTETTPAPDPKRKRGGPSALDDEKQRMTVFGARQNEVRGKPRFLGLILTALLLLFLVGVAAWASIFLDDGLARLFGTGDDIKLADVPASDEPGETDQPEAEGQAGTGVTPLPDGDGGDDGDQIAALPDTETRPDVAALPDLPSPLAPSEALARYAATGIWQMAPTSPDIPVAGAPLADIRSVSVDAGVDLGDPADLPRRMPDARDTRPETPIDPPSAGTRFEFDARGFVRATPDGTLTPQGVRIVAGRPPMTPPADMAQTVTVTATLDTAEDGIAAGQSFAGDPALAETRPRLRPQDLAPEDASTSPGTDDSAVADAEDEARAGSDASAAAAASSLAALRPRNRPETMTASAATLQSAQGAATAPLVDGAALNRAVAAANAPEPEEEADTTEDAAGFDTATAQAVTASLTPLRRPGDFADRVERTRAKAAAQPVPTTQRLQPAMPSSASVAKQATTAKAINLRQVNLIGVYGSTASRRALVRLGNGRYKKVQVGDSLDGGQVAAIGDSELRYIKSGRNVVLRIPQG